MRMMLEGGTMNVFDILLDEQTRRPDAARFNCYMSPQPLRALLNEVFSKSEVVSTNIAFSVATQVVVPDWVEKRVKPESYGG